MIRNFPKLPVTVKDNQYGYMPAKTYYYIVDADGLIYHSGDDRWRSKCLIQLWSYAYRDKTIADQHANNFNNENN